ncbi:MAG: ATP-binding protein [bacterium]|nr:ATP-binding protein [bacterium]
MTQLYLFLMTLNCVLALVPLVFSRRRIATVSFSIAVLSMTSWMAAIFFVWRVPTPLIPLRLAFVGPVFLGYSFLLFVSHYPRPQFNLPKWVYALLAIPPLAIAVIAPTHLIAESINLTTMQVTYGMGHKFFGLVTMGYMGIAFIVGLRGIWVFRGIERLRLVYVINGLLITFSLAIVTNLVLPMMGTNQFTQLGPLFTIFFIASTYFAIYKYRLMNVQFILKKSLFYFLMTSAVSLTFSSLLLHTQDDISVGSHQNLLSVLMSAGLVVFLYPHIRHIIDAATNAVFFRARPNYQRTMKRVGDALLRQVSLDELGRVVTELLPDQLQIIRAALFVSSENEFSDTLTLLRHSGEFSPALSDSIDLPPALMTELKKGVILVTEELAFRYSDVESKMISYGALTKLGWAIAIPLHGDSGLIGVLGLGPKRSDEQYMESELTVFQTLQHQVSTVLNNANSYQRLEARINELKELNRLALYFNQMTNMADIVPAISNTFKSEFGFNVMAFYSPNPLLDGQYALSNSDLHDNKAISITDKMGDLEFPIGELFHELQKNRFQPMDLAYVEDSDVRAFHRSFKSYFQANAILVIPFVAGDELIGCVLGVYQDEKPAFINWSYMETLAREAAVALNNTMLLQRVQQTKDYNDDILHGLAAGVILCDQDLTIIGFNRMTERLVGCSYADAIGASLVSLYGLLPELQQLDRTLVTRKGRTIEAEVSVFGGSNIPMLLSSGVMALGDGDFGLMITLTDISSLKELEIQMMRSERLRSLGMIAAGIAHEIKNPLVAIRTFTQLLPKRWHEDTFRTKFNEVMLPQVERINEMCQSLTQIGTRKLPKMAEEDLGSILHEVSLLLEADKLQLGGSIILESIPKILLLVDRAQIVQVFVNLILNGLQALEGRANGEVRVSAEELDNGQVMVRIVDNGCGMSTETRERLFDPFYSTKESGNGVGMTIVQGIVQDHQGRINVSSQLESGTEFEIILPTLKAIRNRQEVMA